MATSHRRVLLTFAALSACLVLALCMMPGSLMAQETEASEDQERAGAKRLARMREFVQEFQAQPLADGADVDLQLSKEPILRYNDPARNLLDGSVWRIGETGRPHALIAVELNSQPERVLASFEFLAVEQPAFRGSFRGFSWRPPEGFAKFAALSDAPTPAAAERARLTQMKQLARRFTGYQRLEGENYTLRMLAQPVDRYQPSSETRADGAMFAFAYGVNPEVLLLLETDGMGWRYGFLRMSTAQLMVDLDGEQVWTAKATGGEQFQNTTEVYTQARRYLPVDVFEMD